MSALFVLVAVSIAAAAPDSWLAIKRMHEEIRDAEFMYEGEQGVLGDTKTLGSKLQFQSLGRARSDGMIYHEHAREIPYMGPCRCMHAFQGGKFRVLDQPQSPTSLAHQELHVEGDDHLHHLYSFYWLWPIPALSCEPDDVIAGITDLGEKDVDGHRCRVLRFPNFGASFPRIYYFDMERGANVLRIELMLKDAEGNERMAEVMHSVKLLQVRAEDGKMVWFPVSSTVDTFVRPNMETREVEFSDKPLALPRRFVALPQTIKINSGLAPADLEVKFLPGVRVEKVGRVKSPPTNPIPLRKGEVVE